MTDETKIGSPMRKVVTKVLKVGVVGANSGVKWANVVKVRDKIAKTSEKRVKSNDFNIIGDWNHWYTRPIYNITLPKIQLEIIPNFDSYFL